MPPRYPEGVSETTRRLRQCTVTRYRRDVPNVRKTPQRTVGIDDELWQDCQEIAKARRERVTAVIRAALVKYRDENRHLIQRDPGDH